jgi:hypothetical protein
MRYVFLIAAISLMVLTGIPAAQQSIDQMMQSQLSERQFCANDEFNIPLVGQSKGLEYKSKYKAALFSLILPGAGQYYIKSYTTSKVFFGIESGVWLMYFGFRKYSDMKGDAARGWAVLKAGANPDNKDELYWRKMTYYDNRDRNESRYEQGYNQMAPVYDGEDAVLFPETPAYYWNWDSIEDRRRYRNLRNQSKTADERADVAAGVIIANHIVSAIEAYLSTIKYNRRLEFSSSGFQFQYAFDADLSNPGVRILLTKYFD